MQYAERFTTSETVEQLQAENRYLKSLLKAPRDYPREFNLTPKEDLLLRHLHEARSPYMEQELRSVIGYEGKNRKLVTLYIYWLRQKLKTIKVRINQDYGLGYYIDKENRERLNRAVLAREVLPSRQLLEQEWKSAKAA